MRRYGPGSALFLDRDYLRDADHLAPELSRLAAGRDLDNESDRLGDPEEDLERVHTKTPGNPPDRQRPFTLRRGQTVEDVARLVHKDLARNLRFARVWGKSGFDGQQVGREHVMEDGDVVELHA